MKKNSSAPLFFPEKLDSDLTVSKKIVDDIESSESQRNAVNNLLQPQTASSTDKRHHHHQIAPGDAQKANDTKMGRNEWPSFKPETDTGHKVNFAPSSPHRNFKYRIVTDPVPLQHQHQQQPQQQQQPRAYIAVSLIAPKDIDGDDDIVLEDELRRLKPWRENEDPYEALRWSKRDER